MLRTIVWFAYFWIYFILSIPKLYKAKKLKKENNLSELDNLLDKESKKWGKILLKIAGIKVNVKGIENIPKENSIIFVANHQSNFDIPILFASLEKRIAFIAKDDLEKIPFLGSWMRLLKCVFITRNNPRKAIRAIKKGASYVKEGQPMVIFPEGTRSSDGKLNDFKPGSLKLAVKSKGIIVPVTIKGSINAMKKGSLKIKPAKVDLIISEPFSYESFKDTSIMAKELEKTIGSRL